MHKLLNPRWIFIINTVPTIILAILFYSEFTVIKSLLSEENLSYWKWFSVALFALGILNVIYAGFTLEKKKNVSIYYGAIMLLTYIPFLYLFNLFSGEIIPWSIPRWMIPENMTLYSGTFLMPSLVYALLIIIIHTSSDRNAPWKNFLFAILIPIAWYIFFQVILPLWQPIGRDFGEHAILILIISSTVIFLFFLLRGVVILGKKKGGFYKQKKFIWLIPITILLPLIGLGLNNGIFWNGFEGIFGDFSSIWFYLLAVLNGTLLCLPDFPIRKYRIILFAGRVITFMYTLYFFLIFLPLLPFSILAIIAVGTGFLMLTPLVLFVIHFQQLSTDWKYLSSHVSNGVLLTILFGGMTIIPAFIVISHYHDKMVLNETLSYLYSPDYSKEYKLDKNSLKKSIETIKHHKDRNGNIFGSRTPILSLLYNSIVLDNLTLSDSKINHIEKVFFGESDVQVRNTTADVTPVKISNINTTSQYNAHENYWTSWIDLELTNHSIERWGAEYQTTFTLPAGCWISDYYLYVGDKKEYGMLTEKKSATWIYSSIRSINRDPGILYYLTGNRVAFKIFPFLQNETRKSGIEFIHKEAVEITIDNHTITLGNPEKESGDAYFENSSVAYIPAEAKANLNKVKRNPYLHFIVDTSNGKETLQKEYQNRIDNFVSNNTINSDNARVSFTNSEVNTVPFTDWKNEIDQQSFSGGFFLERALQKILVDHYGKNDATYPIIIVLTDSLENAILTKNLADLQFTFPENEFFYSLERHAELVKYSLLDKALQVGYRAKLDPTPEVLEYRFGSNQIAYLPNDGKPGIILKKKKNENDDTPQVQKNWSSAASIQGLQMHYQLHPEIANQEWVDLIEMSFKSKILTPLTSYIVVENEAQRKALLRKQEEVLSGNKDLDTGEDAQSMSEPEITIVLVLFCFTLIWTKRKRILTRFSL